ncbi:hypothetical protein LY78DRAFT_326510 [Colletotrichum sublineola]|nr:hypothetical protein LY78DRAFT_326510 [Colletotrichum sublineola]
MMTLHTIVRVRSSRTPVSKLYVRLHHRFVLPRYVHILNHVMHSCASSPHCPPPSLPNFTPSIAHSRCSHLRFVAPCRPLVTHPSGLDTLDTDQPVVFLALARLLCIAYSSTARSRLAGRPSSTHHSPYRMRSTREVYVRTLSCTDHSIGGRVEADINDTQRRAILAEDK